MAREKRPQYLVEIGASHLVGFIGPHFSMLLRSLQPETTVAGYERIVLRVRDLYALLRTYENPWRDGRPGNEWIQRLKQPIPKYDECGGRPQNIKLWNLLGDNGGPGAPENTPLPDPISAGPVEIPVFKGHSKAILLVESSQKLSITHGEEEFVSFNEGLQSSKWRMVDLQMGTPIKVSAKAELATGEAKILLLYVECVL
jgi:hypothetical protein